MPPERAWVHPEAIAEARAAREWYEARNAEAAERFTVWPNSTWRLRESRRHRANGRLTSPTRADICSADFPSSWCSERQMTVCRLSLLPTLDGGLDTGLAGNSSTLNLTRRSSGPGARAARNLAAERHRSTTGEDRGAMDATPD